VIFTASGLNNKQVEIAAENRRDWATHSQLIPIFDPAKSLAKILSIGQKGTRNGFHSISCEI
jgi:hypothetical protein